MGRKIVDLTGKSFGKTTVISRGPNTEESKPTWRCLCSCGNYHNSTSANLKQGKTKSCGCIRSTRTGNMHRTHSDSNSKEFSAWHGMKTRCLNKKYHRYKDHGGRGITICSEWINSYEKFLSHVGRAPSKNHSIDRINNEGNYEPGNVKWSTPKEQANNRRKRTFVSQ